MNIRARIAVLRIIRVRHPGDEIRARKAPRGCGRWRGLPARYAPGFRRVRFRSCGPGREHQRCGLRLPCGCGGRRARTLRGRRASGRGGRLPAHPGRWLQPPVRPDDRRDRSRPCSRPPAGRQEGMAEPVDCYRDARNSSTVIPPGRGSPGASGVRRIFPECTTGTITSRCA
jgi:hypothetical protein